MDTIFALSSGHPPAAIAIVRISGPAAFGTIQSMAGALSTPRAASLRRLRDADGETLDHALVLTFPGPSSATGEDLGELHLHGGRAVVDAVLADLGRRPGLRLATAGEFTRRALRNGRVDLAQAQGLADLLEAETDSARRAALATTEGHLSRAVTSWMARLSVIAAMIEAAIDHSDEDDVDDNAEVGALAAARILEEELRSALARPSVERLRDGALVVLAGPPNAGKSSLFNALLGRDAAIVTPIAGTTRDVIEAAVVRNGVAFRLVDTAGLTDDSDDVVELIGVTRAARQIEAADTVLWLGAPDDAPARSVLVSAKADRHPLAAGGDTLQISVHWPASIHVLWAELERLHRYRPASNAVHFHDAERRMLVAARNAIDQAIESDDLLASAEHVREAHRAFAALLGINATEAMLDALFGRFCIGK